MSVAVSGCGAAAVRRCHAKRGLLHRVQDGWAIVVEALAVGLALNSNLLAVAHWSCSLGRVFSSAVAGPRVPVVFLVPTDSMTATLNRVGALVAVLSKKTGTAEFALCSGPRDSTVDANRSLVVCLMVIWTRVARRCPTRGLYVSRRTDLAPSLRRLGLELPCVARGTSHGAIVLRVGPRQAGFADMPGLIQILSGVAAITCVGG